MTTPKYAIPLQNANIALKYGNTVSKGIENMEEIIKNTKSPKKRQGFDSF